jgi:hypothetical protein
LNADLTDAADVERTHRELRSRLADRLGCNDANCLANVDDVAACQITSVALHADTAPRLTRQHGTNLDAINAGVLDERDFVFGDLGVGRNDHIAAVRIHNVVQRNSTQDAITDALDDFPTLDEWGGIDTFHGAAVVVGNDAVLRHVDESAS